MSKEQEVDKQIQNGDNKFSEIWSFIAIISYSATVMAIRLMIAHLLAFPSHDGARNMQILLSSSKSSDYILSFRSLCSCHREKASSFRQRLDARALVGNAT